MARGDAELQAMILRLRELPGIARRAAPDAADAVRAALERQIGAATDPTGSPWAPQKEGGGKALTGAEKALAVAAHGSRIYCRLKGHIARHHHGRARGGTVRRILPTEGIPPNLARAVRETLVDHFQREMRGL